MSREYLGRVMIYAMVVFILIIFIAPIVFLFETSLKTPTDIISSPLGLFNPTMENWRQLFSFPGLGTSIQNSLVLVLSTVTLSLCIGSFAGYSVSRYKVGGPSLRLAVLSIVMMPPVAIALPMFTYSISVKMQGSLLFLILVDVAINMPVCFLIMTASFDAVPKELDEAAMLDGCSPLYAFLRIIFPLAAPGMAASAVITAIYCWKEFMLALVLTSATTRTASVFAASQLGFMEFYWGRAAAVGTLLLLPPAFGAFFMQKYLVSGLSLGAIKR